jgi:co-chaperonin GroES (HSP10)
MTIKPRKNFVLLKVKPKQVQEKLTKGGIVIPQQISEILEASNHLVCEVENVGPAVSDLEIGSLVILPKHAGNKFKEDDVDYVLVEENQILATC